MEAISLDLGAEGFTSSSYLPVKPWASFLTYLRFGFSLAKWTTHNPHLASSAA